MIKSEFYDLRYSFVISFFLLSGLYIYSMPINLTLEDDGFFVMSAWFNGVAHSPGYPLHTIFGHLATLLPVGTIPFRVHAVSAVFGILTALTLLLITYHLFKNKLLALFSSIILGSSDAFWSQSIIAEVYTLNTFIFSVIIYMALHIDNKSTSFDTRKRLFMLSALVLGLGLSNHWPLIILGSSLLGVLYYPYYKDIIRYFPRLLLLLIIGLLPYALMIYRSWQDPVFNFMGKIDSFENFWFIVSRAQYASVDQSSTADIFDKLQFSFWFSKQLFTQFFWILSLFGLLGFIGQWFVLSKRIAMALTISFITSSFLLIWMLGFDYEPIKQSLIRVYFLPAYMIFVIWIIAGMYILAQFFSTQFNINKRLIFLMFAMFVGIQPLIFLTVNDRHKDRFSLDYTRLIFSLIPKNSVLIVDDDITSGVFGYYHYVMGYRPDLTLISSLALGFNNRLYHPVNANMDERNQAVSSFFFTTKKGIYSTVKYDIFDRYGMTDYGIFLKFSPELKQANRKTVFIPEVYNDLLQLSSMGILNDPWEESLRQETLARSVSWVLSFRDALNQKEYDFEKLIHALSSTPASALELLEQLSLIKDKTLLTKHKESLIFYLKEHQLDKASKARLKGLIKKVNAISDAQ